MLDRRPVMVFTTLCLVLIASLYLGARIGAVDVDNAVFWRLLTNQAIPEDHAIEQILIHIRLPRVVAAALVGGSLAIAGAVMQGLFRNPLVDPGIVGVMSGASLAASLGIIFGGAFVPAFYGLGMDYFLPITAFIGGWLMTMVLYFFSKRGGVINISSMILIGIAFGAFFGALTGLLTYAADDNQLRSIAFWNMGSLASFDWHKLAILTAITALTVPILWRDAYILNALMLGENVAGHLGFDVERAKKRQILLVALLVGACVAFSGGIGFVGLVVPHIVRRILGSNNRFVLPASFLFGAALLELSDLVARTIVSPAELPIGILTAMIGGPFLGFLVWRGAGR